MLRLRHNYFFMNVRVHRWLFFILLCLLTVADIPLRIGIELVHQFLLEFIVVITCRLIYMSYISFKFWFQIKYTMEYSSRTAGYHFIFQIYPIHQLFSESNPKCYSLQIYQQMSTYLSENQGYIGPIQMWVRWYDMKVISTLFHHSLPSWVGKYVRLKLHKTCK